MPRSCGIRNRRGRGLPSDGQAETEPISTWPKPIEPSIPTARPFLSKPAASPSGFSSGMPASVVRSRGSVHAQRPARDAARKVARPDSSETRSVSSCARSGRAGTAAAGRRPRTGACAKAMRCSDGGPPERRKPESPVVRGSTSSRRWRRDVGGRGRRRGRRRPARPRTGSSRASSTGSTGSSSRRSCTAGGTT